MPPPPHDPPSARPVVQADALRFAYPGPDAFTLEHPALRIAEGQHTACIGPSGCGKTTLLRLLIGVLRPTEGRVLVDGREISAMREADRRQARIVSVGMVFQTFALLDYLSALDNILLPYRISTTLRLDADALERARGLAAELGIAPLLDRMPARLSQGERQRVAICRALVTRPRLIACDEPTGNLDPDRSRATLDLLAREAEAISATLLVVTHDHALLPRFAQVIDMGEEPA